jgi:hypothetical protein
MASWLIVKFDFAVISSVLSFSIGVRCLSVLHLIIFPSYVRILADITDPASGSVGPRYLPNVIFEVGNGAFCSL